MTDNSNTASCRDNRDKCAQETETVNNSGDRIGVWSTTTSDGTISENGKPISTTDTSNSKHQERVNPTEDSGT